MAKNYPYITKPNERWDNVAYKAYGNALLSEVIIVANPEIKVTDVLPEGITIQIPILENSSPLIKSDLLPPWK